jgi:hypothetical protein
VPRSKNKLSPSNRKLNKIFALLPSHNFTFLKNINKIKKAPYSGTTRRHISHVSWDSVIIIGCTKLKTTHQGSLKWHNINTKVSGKCVNWFKSLKECNMCACMCACTHIINQLERRG